MSCSCGAVVSERCNLLAFGAAFRLAFCRSNQLPERTQFCCSHLYGKDLIVTLR